MLQWLPTVLRKQSNLSAQSLHHLTSAIASFTTNPLMILKPVTRNYFRSQMLWAPSCFRAALKALAWFGTRPFLSSSSNSFKTPQSSLLHCSCHRRLELSRN